MLMINWIGALVWREGAGHYIRGAAVPSGVEECHFRCMAVARRAGLNKKDTDTPFDHDRNPGSTAVT